MVFVQGAEIKPARNAKELMGLFEEGSKNRHVASTSTWNMKYLLWNSDKYLSIFQCPVSYFCANRQIFFLHFRNECGQLEIPFGYWNNYWEHKQNIRTSPQRKSNVVDHFVRSLSIKHSICQCICFEGNSDHTCVCSWVWLIWPEVKEQQKQGPVQSSSKKLCQSTSHCQHWEMLYLHFQVTSPSFLTG